ncbi:amidohydrolase family protein [Kitasatospora sp. NBC_01539]|uniref:amidohydrolase family protein n=1 Tax=Kitasatospora sp. NBC_01539 TaxID=2903577 RepID=UPI0038602DFD
MTQHTRTARTRTVLTRVRVFDGRRIGEPGTVVIDGGVIGTDSGTDSGTDRVVRVDGGGAVLLPGLIDAHVHLHGPETLERLASHGVTTALDMATWPPELAASLRNVPGVTDIRSAGTPAIGPGGPHARIPGLAGTAVVTDPEHAKQFVADRVAEGSDYLKVVLEAPGDGGIDGPVLAALVAAAHAHGRAVVAHASSHGAWTTALDAGVDHITHIPLGRPLDPAEVARAAAGGRVAIPTLTMMEGIAVARGVADALSGASRSVGALHRAGVPVLAGTDANVQPGVPARVEHGASLHRELELLVAAGLSTADALRAATSLPARHFGLADRGVIAPGLRADLVLVDGDPLADIRATRAIRRVWCGGVEHAVA